MVAGKHLDAFIEASGSEVQEIEDAPHGTEEGVKDKRVVSETAANQESTRQGSSSAGGASHIVNTSVDQAAKTPGQDDDREEQEQAAEKLDLTRDSLQEEVFTEYQELVKCMKFHDM